MKVAIYVRVSTDKQELDNQLAQLKRYAVKSKWEIYHEYKDIVSGKETKRKDYDQMFKDAHKKLFDGVLFWSLDRFSRTGTLFTLQKLKELDNLNIFWHSYQDPYISTAGEWKDGASLSLLLSSSRSLRGCLVFWSHSKTGDAMFWILPTAV